MSLNMLIGPMAASTLRGRLRGLDEAVLGSQVEHLTGPDSMVVGVK
jgi:hypothetical protein